MVLGKDIDELLESFGNHWLGVKGFFCKLPDCFSCEFFFTCHKRPPTEKVSVRFDYVLSMIEHGFPLTREEFHLEVKRPRK